MFLRTWLLEFFVLGGFLSFFSLELLFFIWGVLENHTKWLGRRNRQGGKQTKQGTRSMLKAVMLEKFRKNFFSTWMHLATSLNPWRVLYSSLSNMLQDFVFESLNYSLLFREPFLSQVYCFSSVFSRDKLNLDMSVGRKSGKACFLLEKVWKKLIWSLLVWRWFFLSSDILFEMKK